MDQQLSQTLQRLKDLREEFGISIEEMAQTTDVSPADYLAIENGIEDLSFTFLFKCAKKLGVDIAAIVTGEEPRLTSYTLSRAGEGMPIKRREGFDYSHIAYLFKDRLTEPFVVTAKYSREMENEPMAMASHAGQEFNYILEGILKFQIEDHVEILKPGDSLYYDGHKKHGMIALGGSDCKFLSVVIKGNAEDEDPSQLVMHAHMEKVARHRRYDDKVYKKYVRETLDDMNYLKAMDFNIPDNFNFGFDCVDAVAKKLPDKMAMFWVSASGEERKFSFSDISKASNQTANYLLSLGVKKGDKVMVVLRRHYQFWYTMVALHKVGAVAIPATDQLTAKDFAYRYDAAGVKAVICTGKGMACKMAEEAAKVSPTVEIFSRVDDPVKSDVVSTEYDAELWSDFNNGIAKQSTDLERVDTHKDDPMIMFFSSGTTGYPKLVNHSYCYPLGHVITAKWWHNVDPEGLHFTISDTGWGKAVWGKLYGQWLCEAAVFTCDFDRFKPVDLLPMFKKYNITTFCAPPTMFRFFIKEDLTKYDLSSLQYVTIAGEALNPEVFNQFEKATGLKLMEGFGQTETTLTIANLLGMEPKPGSMGKPSPGYDVRLLDTEGHPVKFGEVGEIVVGTKHGNPVGLFAGYEGDSELTEKVWHDGYYHTGDMAWQDEDGYLWYVSRTDDIIKSSGYRIGPFEVESVVMEMACVLECAITGVPDLEGERGQLVKATIVLTDEYKAMSADRQASEELKKEIQSYVKKNTAPYKYPRVIEFVEALPKTISGKIRRSEIRKS
ncbi:MAG: AMP-binding protein [Anaerovoracaceae bacterium]